MSVTQTTTPAELAQAIGNYLALRDARQDILMPWRLMGLDQRYAHGAPTMAEIGEAAACVSELERAHGLVRITGLGDESVAWDRLLVALRAADDDADIAAIYAAHGVEVESYATARSRVLLRDYPA